MADGLIGLLFIVFAACMFVLFGWKCPGCGRVVKLCKYDKEYSVFVGQRWPRHYTT